jgi:hypothetical protein
MVLMATIQYLGPRRLVWRCLLALKEHTPQRMYRVELWVFCEIEIRFQFQSGENNIELRNWSSLRDEHSGQKGNGKFVVAGDRETSAGAVLGWPAHDVG